MLFGKKSQNITSRRRFAPGDVHVVALAILFVCHCMYSGMATPINIDETIVGRGDPTIGKWMRQWRQLQQQSIPATAVSPIAADAYGHLLELCMDGSGQPNPRITCTDGHHHAAEYVEEQMRQIGLVPLGNAARTTFSQIVQDSVDATWCPHGIRNLIGMVPGSLYPNEYIVYEAHLDGPNNGNPQTARTRNNRDVSNAYDDGLAVAVGLAIAKQMMQNKRPERSVVFFFDDGEEGWPSVGVRQDGESNLDACGRYVKTKWYRSVYENAGGVKNQRDSCPAFAIGAFYWVKNPTIDFSAIKMVYAIDPLGSSYNTTLNDLAALGGDQTLFQTTTRSQTSTLDDFLDVVWPADSSVKLYSGPQGSISGLYSSLSAFQTEYSTLCGGNCVTANGIPGVWLAQPAFQKYHSGAEISLVKQIFGTALGSGTFNSPAHFSVDNLVAFYLPNLDATVSSLYRLLDNTANSAAVSNLRYNGSKGNTIVRKDMEHLVNMLEMLLTASRETPRSIQGSLLSMILPLLVQANGLLGFDLSVSSTQSQAQMIAQATVGLFISIDFFSEMYPDGEPYLDQTFRSGSNIVASEATAPVRPPSTGFIPPPILLRTPPPIENPSDMESSNGDSSTNGGDKTPSPPTSTTPTASTPTANDLASAAPCQLCYRYGRLFLQGILFLFAC